MNAQNLRQRASQIGLAALAAAVLVAGAAWRGTAASSQSSGAHTMPVVSSPIAHAVAGTDAKVSLGDFPPLLIVIDAVIGAILGAIGGAISRSRRAGTA